MSKFKVGDHVRVTAQNRFASDQVGDIMRFDATHDFPYVVEFAHHIKSRYKEHELTLADPDVHTVLDEMDAESAPTQADLGPHFAAIEKSQAEWDAMVTPDPVSAPSHYRSHPSGIETITITRHESFLRGNVLKYVLRAPYKDSEIEDLKKAAQYLQWEIDRAEAAQ